MRLLLIVCQQHYPHGNGIHCAWVSRIGRRLRYRRNWRDTNGFKTAFRCRACVRIQTMDRWPQAWVVQSISKPPCVLQIPPVQQEAQKGLASVSFRWLGGALWLAHSRCFAGLGVDQPHSVPRLFRIFMSGRACPFQLRSIIALGLTCALVRGKTVLAVANRFIAIWHQTGEITPLAGPAKQCVRCWYQIFLANAACACRRAGYSAR